MKKIVIQLKIVPDQYTNKSEHPQT